MADTRTYRIWQSPESVLIQAETGSIELSIAEAVALAVEITARLAPAAPAKRVLMRWTPELDTEVARLYRDGLGATRIADRLGVPKGSISHALKRAGVTIRSARVDKLTGARAARAAKRAARQAA